MVHGPCFHESFILADVKEDPEVNNPTELFDCQQEWWKDTARNSMGEEAGDASQNGGRKASVHRTVSGETAQV